MARIRGLFLAMVVLAAQCAFVLPSAVAANNEKDVLANDSAANNSWANDSGANDSSVEISDIDRKNVKIAMASPTITAGLTPGAQEAARLLGVMPQVERLLQLKQANQGQDPANLNDEQLNLRVFLLDKIVGQSLEVRMVSDRIDRELAWAYVGKGMLEGRRQRNLNFLFTGNFLQGGILGVCAGPEFLHGDSRAGSELLLLGSSIGLGLSIAAFIEARRGSKKMDGETTVLADLFELPQPGEKQHHPDAVMKYLNSVPPITINNQTRKQALLASWKKGRYMRSNEEKQLNKLAALQPPGAQYRENIRLLGSRIRMLYDVQWTIEQLDGDLLDLLRATD